jgi:Ice-binding-like
MKRRYLSSLVALGFAALFYGPSPALAQVAPPLGVFGQFGILAAQGVTANGTTVVSGDVGSYPTPSITGAGLSTIAPWTIHFAADAVVQQAQVDATAAYLNLAGQGGTVIPAGLGGTTLGPGVYTFATTADIAASTNFTLTGAGVYVFNVPSSLTANVLSTVTLNGVDPCLVFWRVGTAATLNGVNFPGTVIANAAVSLGDAMNLQGRAASLTAAITIAATGQTIGGCSSLPAPTLPEIGAWALLVVLLGSGAYLLSRRTRTAASR